MREGLRLSDLGLGGGEGGLDSLDLGLGTCADATVTVVEGCTCFFPRLYNRVVSECSSNQKKKKTQYLLDTDQTVALQVRKRVRDVGDRVQCDGVVQDRLDRNHSRR
jgi:hypothetical protein